MAAFDWYTISNIDELDSPSLVVYPDLVKQNIKTLIESIDDVNRLRPHIKTHKSSEVSKMMLAAGIKKFKCATIAEAEMLATAGAKDVLLAYQPVGPKVYRLSNLVQQFPDVKWACLIDDVECARDLSYVFEKKKLTINVYIDLNVGMDRTGIVPGDAFGLFDDCRGFKGISIVGLHAYDGHLRDTDYDVRARRCDEAFASVKKVQEEIYRQFGKTLIVVAGGTPTFSIHSKRQGRECSPGTYVYWDRGYEKVLQEQHYLYAALVITRVVSIPADNTICVDLGHKAIASENPLTSRVYFLNAPDLEAIAHSEEHMVFKSTTERKYKVGDVLYGVPYHICPTVALHDVVNVIVDHRVKENWNTAARKRKITI
jgi:D-serine deaminase-like pyridoxal phosphate-dependent protein